MTPSTLDTVLRESYRYISPENLAALMKDPAGVLFQYGAGSDTLTTVQSLEPLGGYASHARYHATASIVGPGEVDTYALWAPGSPDDAPGPYPGSTDPTVGETAVTAADALPSSLAVASPPAVALIAGLIVLFVASYVAFQRQEVRA